MSRYVEMVVAAVASTLAFALAPAMAQEKQGEGIDTVVITSAKRSEESQKVALTVRALDENMLKEQQVNTVTDLAQVVPGFQIQKISGTSYPFLRGLGLQASGPWQEVPVSSYVDGVYLVDSAAINNSILNNLQRVEVIKGPQGTLFGRNALGGVVSYITKDPSHVPSLDMSFGYGNYDTRSASLYGTTGITDTLAANISFAGEDQRQGWGTNLYTGNPVHTAYKYSLRSKVVWTPNDATKITLSGDWGRSISAETGSGTSNGVFPFIVAGPKQVGGFYDVYNPSDPFNETRS
jgi:iron complex outermembrane receptor protein